MATILSQLLKLKTQIKLPYEIRFVDREILKEEFEEKVIYIHITI
jgi:chemotaxis protein CheY-P-specific phosphatase CheC